MEEAVNLTDKDLNTALIESKDPNEIQDLVKLFDLNLKKKELIRASILSDLQDKIVEQAGKRIEKNSDSFSNKDLLDYMNSIQSILNKKKEEGELTIPQIAIQNNIMVSDPSQELTKDSRDKITDIIKQFMMSQEEEHIVDDQ